MALTMLSDSGASKTGNWIDIRSTVGKTYPHRITAYGAFTTGKIIIERIDGDNSIAANVIQVAQLNQNDEVVIDAPTDWIRARSDANVAGAAFLVLDSTTA
jgi:hypothetical protein